LSLNCYLSLAVIMMREKRETDERNDDYADGIFRKSKIVYI